jgi:hypothetical protein
MSDAAMCQLLSVADLGHIMSLLVLPSSVKNLADFIRRAHQPKPRWFAAVTPTISLLEHFISSMEV